MQRKVSMWFFDGEDYIFLCSSLAVEDDEGTSLVVFDVDKLEMLYDVIKEQLALARESGFVA